MNDAQIYEELRWDLMRFATSLVGPDQAGDVVSTVIGRVLARRGGLAGLSDPKPYLVRAIQNEARNRYRADARRATVPIGIGTQPTVGLGDDELLDLLLTLPPRQRAAIYLTSYEGYEPSEAAALLGCRPATLRRYLHIARTKLREALDD